MDDLLREMGERILARRKQLCMTQEELAEAAGVTPQVYHYFGYVYWIYKFMSGIRTNF